MQTGGFGLPGIIEETPSKTSFDRERRFSTPAVPDLGMFGICVMCMLQKFMGFFVPTYVLYCFLTQGYAANNLQLQKYVVLYSLFNSVI